MDYFNYARNEIKLLQTLLDANGLDHVCQMLDVKPPTIRTWLHRGRVPYQQVRPIHEKYNLHKQVKRKGKNK